MKYLTVSQLSKITGKSPKTIQVACSSGKIQCRVLSFAGRKFYEIPDDPDAYAALANSRRGRRVVAKTYAGERHYEIRDAAHREATNAIKRGDLQRSTTCSECSIEAFTEAHHDDYAKPLDVVWLCKKCHTKRHIDPEVAARNSVPDDSPVAVTPAELAAMLGSNTCAIRKACKDGILPFEPMASGGYAIPNTAEVAAVVRGLPKRGRPSGAKDSPLVSYGGYRVSILREGVYKCSKRGRGGKTFCHGVSPEIVVQSAPLPELVRAELLRQLALRKE